MIFDIYDKDSHFIFTRRVKVNVEINDSMVFHAFENRGMYAKLSFYEKYWKVTTFVGNRRNKLAAIGAFLDYKNPSREFWGTLNRGAK